MQKTPVEQRLIDVGEPFCADPSASNGLAGMLW